MKRIIKHFLKFTVVFFLSFTVLGTPISVGTSFDSDYLLMPPDTTLRSDTTAVDLIYPFNNDDGIPLTEEQSNPIFFNDPPNITTEVQYDPLTNRYILTKKIGNLIYRPPTSMSFDEYLNYDINNSLKKYWKERSKASGADKRTGIIPEIHIGGAAFEKIFGSNTIDIRPNGSAELSFGIRGNSNDDPNKNVRQRRQINFDFKETIQMNVIAKIGDKIEFKTNYNTEATFDFENKLQLKYEGKEDEIIKLIEAGDVTLPLNSTLITGAHSLFGIKTKLQFGKATVTTVFSQQKGESSNITVQGGAQTSEFELKASDYEENKHFFLAQYFRDHYEGALAKLPIVSSAVNITKLEVWVTNIGAAVTENRNIVALMDLGENDPYNKGQISPIVGNVLPSNNSNNLVSKLDTSQIRNINTVTNYLKGSFNFTPGQDFEKVESARKLSASEYSYNKKLGFISLHSGINSDQTLAVSFQYTVIGYDTVFQVGEFSDQGIVAPNCLMVKLLKSTSLNTRIPMWDLMMKNVYSMGAYQVNSDGFILNILYSGNDNGVPTGYLTEGPEGVRGVPLIRVLNFDNLDPQLNPPPDGIFDFLNNAATNGGTIQASNGRVYFTMLEPFGSYLRKKLKDPDLSEKYCFDSLYTMTKTGAEQFPDKNKFLIEGFYKSSAGSEISLNALNVPQGSVVVSAGGRPLTENVDYTVDYTLGRVRIINEGILNSGAPINISMESTSFFNIQTKRLMGTHLDYKFDDNFVVGATILNLTEKPLTQKVIYGDDPISNTIWGFNFSYQTESRFITKMIDKLPFLTTKAPSRISIDGEFAHFIPGHSKIIGKTGTTYVDDFEGSKSTLDLTSIYNWFMASTPQYQTTPDMFPEAKAGTGLDYGINRALFSWYVIDPLFYDKRGNLRPPNVDKNEISNNYVRQVLENELFPDKDIPNGIPTNIPILNLAFYPNERGANNYDVNASPYSQGIDENGKLIDPESRWGGIMRRFDNTDFEAANYEYIEFWMMDPFMEDSTNSGQLYFNLGDVSEDILRDSRKAYENGLPTTDLVENVDSTEWGRVPNLQALTHSFSDIEDSRIYQDIGYDGLSTFDERIYYDNYLQKIQNEYGVASLAYALANADPSSDNYHYFRGADYDENNLYRSILERYKKFNGTEGNSPTDAINPEDYPTAATNDPNVEDINNDNTLSEAERYFQYRVNFDPSHMKVGENYITDVRHIESVPLANQKIGKVTWYQFKIPIRDPDKIIGNIQDFKSIRFLRMFFKNFKRPVVCRFATLDLVRGEWRKYNEQLLSQGEYIVDNQTNQTIFDVSAVNIEENGERYPIPYMIPPGIERERNLGTTSSIQLNEQAMSIKVCDLVDGDARGVYKTTDFDFRQYKFLKMFAHAEKSFKNEQIKYGDLTVFIRIGSDFTQNYYEYEVPLTFTPWGVGKDREAIWPEGNIFDIELQKLIEVKKYRNLAMREPGSHITISDEFIQYDGENKITVVGMPSISDVGAIMIGVRNPKKRTLVDDDDGHSKCAEIWVNELRLTGFNKKGGWAATARISADLADLGNVTISGMHSTAGFGALNMKLNETQKETITQFDISTNLELGKFLPEKSGIRVPLHFDYSEGRITPEYNPLDPDVKLKDELNTYETKAEKDSVLSKVQDYTQRKNINFINVRKDKVGGSSSKPHFYDIENFDFSYSYSEIFNRNIDISYNLKKINRGGFGYTHTTQPKLVKPFEKIKFLKSSWLKLIKDFNFYFEPKMLSFRTEMNREFSRQLIRNKSNALIIIEPTFVKKWDWTRVYDMKFDLSKSLSLDFSANVNAYISEPYNYRTKGEIGYKEYRDSVVNEILGFGTLNHYTQNLALNYKIPIDKLPLLEWITSTARYQSGYHWTASPRSIQDELGNQIENSNTIQLSGNFTLDKLYNKVGFLKKINKGGGGSRSGGGRRMQSMPTPEKEKDTTKAPKVNYLKIIGNTFLRVLMGVKNASITYSESNGIFLPGFIPEPNALGNNWGSNAPGLGFIFGSQSDDFRYNAARNNWITADSNLNTAYFKKHTNTLNVRVAIEPFPDLKIELTADRSFSKNHQEYFKYDRALEEFKSFSPTESGSFSISTITWGTAFAKNASDNTSETFENLKKYRLQIATRLAKNNPNWNGLDVDSAGFPEGYGPTSQDVLIPSFVAAYRGKPAGNASIEQFPKIPLPNWRITYNGLSQIEFFKKYIRSISISHAYRSTYSIGSFISQINYGNLDESPINKDDIGDYFPKYDISQISISEQFSPLFNIDITWNNNLMTKFELKKSRNLGLSFVNNQLTEVTSNEVVIGAGYRFKNVKFGIKSSGGSGSRSNVSSDLNLKFDFSIRSNKTVLRRIDEDIDQVSAGQKILTIGTTADYAISQSFNVRLYFDKVINKPFVASNFRTSITNAGVSLRFTLNQ